ncbi:MAG: c-type cytochrome [Myxococcales bacterium]|nr:MAG: c-type cytochrome [Myxococcales bacterium]
MSRLQAIAVWFDERLHLTKLFDSTAGHTVPANAGSWFYVFGSATLVCFVIQVVTGVCLALVYQPSASQAWASLEYLNFQQPLGWYLRALHGWGSNFMVAIMAVHMAQVFLFGAYKYPREMTWISGLLLLLCTLGMAFTGQIMRFDQDAYWGLGIGASIMGRVPLIGNDLVHLVLGGPIIAGETLSRFVTLHVFVIPGAIIAIVALHLRLVLTAGINEYPEPGKPVVKETYHQEYEALLEEQGVPFYPKAIDKDIVFSGLVILAIFVCAAVFGPFGPNGEPDPTLIHTAPRPDFFFLWLFAALALLPPYLETFLLLAAPVVGLGLLFALPFISGTGEKSPRSRPVAVVGVVMVFLTIGALTSLAVRSAWSPVMDAWSSTPTPIEYLEGRTPLELQGAVVIQAKQCRNCHALGGDGGERGPALDGVAVRRTRDQLIRQVLQGGGNMPAYGKNLKPAEVTALVAFMETLHTASRAPERDAAAAERR